MSDINSHKFDMIELRELSLTIFCKKFLFLVLILINS